MYLVHQYRKHLFEKMRLSPMVLLLNGTSIKQLEKHISKLENRDMLYIAINNKFVIEENILDKIDKKINIWCICSPNEVEKYWKEIYDFYLIKNLLPSSQLLLP